MEKLILNMACYLDAPGPSAHAQAGTCQLHRQRQRTKRPKTTNGRTTFCKEETERVFLGTEGSNDGRAASLLKNMEA